MMEKEEDLPVPVLDYPHWRVNTYPERFERERIKTLSECLDLLRRTNVRLRGWAYPHISPRPNELSFGNNFVASWAHFMSQIEYWRFYQSAQFIHLSAVREVTEASWTEKLRRRASHSIVVGAEGVNWDGVPGFFSLPNIIYTFSEIFEFAARLCASGVYVGNVRIDLQINEIAGFVLVAEEDRSLHQYYHTASPALRKSWDCSSRDLLSNTVEIVLDALTWFMGRFGWIDPPRETLRADVSDYLKKS